MYVHNNISCLEDMFARQAHAVGSPSFFHVCLDNLSSVASPCWNSPRFQQLDSPFASVCYLAVNTTKRHHLPLLSSCSCLGNSQSIFLLRNLKDGTRSRTALAQASTRKDKKGKSPKQPKTGNRSSAKTGNPWVEGSSMAPRSNSSPKKKANAWNENAKQVSSSSKAKAVEKRSSNGAISSMGKVFISGMMLTAEEELLQPYETVVCPSWSTFASSNAGIWQGVAAAFSPFTAELEPIISISTNKNMYDCKTWNISKLIRSPEPSKTDVVHRKVLWNAESNLRGEMDVHSTLQENHQTLETEDRESEDVADISTSDISDSGLMSPKIASAKLDDKYTVQKPLMDSDANLGYGQGNDESETRQHEHRNGSLVDHRSHESRAAKAMNESDSDVFDATKNFDVMEEDYMALESGLVFFEDGSYSRGPLRLLEETTETSTAPLPSVFKIEQCLVRGGHTRLRIVQTIEVEEGGAAVQVLRLIVFEEEWKGPSNWTKIDATGATLSSLAQQKRLEPDELKGNWKVFEIDASAIYETGAKDGLAISNASLQHLCKETRISRQLPNRDLNSESSFETENNGVLWLLGGVYTYMDVTVDGMLIVGVGWLGKDSTNLVMERLYDPDGNLAEVRSKSEIKVR